jgi:hypothetical protein
VRKVILIGVLALAVLLVGASVALGADRTVSCGQDLDAAINGDGATTATRFVLEAGCTFTISATAKLKNGDDLVCETSPTFQELAINEREGETHLPDSAYDPTTFCTVQGGSAVAQVIARIDDADIEGITIRGGNYTGQAGTGTGLKDGSASDAAEAFGIVVENNEGAGITNCHGDYNRIELRNNTTNADALGHIGSGIKCIDEAAIRHSWVHDTQGNGIWCDEGCTDRAVGVWHVNFNVIEDNGKDGVRWEFDEPGVANPGEALIEHNEIHGNVRTGVQARDAGEAEIRDNIFGGNGTAVRASDSGRSDRFNLVGIWIHHNVLNGDTLQGCELPDSIVDCHNNGGSSGSLSEPSEPAPDEPTGEPSSSDIDGDGIANTEDPDKDGDGVRNRDDSDPKDPGRN